MKVSLAAQTLSSSVAKALTFAYEANIKGFESCMATVKYLEVRMIINFQIFLCLFRFLFG